MNEAEALAILDGRGMYGQHLGLDTIRGMLATLGDPHKQLRVIHVAGTNGKGSVCAMLASALTAAGHKTGLYTSPHLVKFHERIRVNEADIRGEELAHSMARIQPALDAYPKATYFEVATALALQHFADAGCDIVVLEVGLGGRLDATNVIDTPVATVITNISVEHSEVLGKDEASIAREKGGIIKPGAPLITGATGEALAVLRGLAAERGASVRVLGDDFIPLPGDVTSAGQTLEVSGLRDYGDVMIPLLGAHQAENAALALAALDAFSSSTTSRRRGGAEARGGDTDSVPIAAAREGLARTRWPGRLQRIVREGEADILLDGAHNPAGMMALVEYLKTTGERPVVLFGALADKEWGPMVEALIPHVRDGIVTRVPSPRALEPQEAARMFSQMGLFGMVVDEPGHALRTAAGVAGPDGVVLVTGSLYLVGHVLGRL